MDLLIDNKLLGLDIVKKLKEISENDLNCQFEIIVVSRSTNTEDIQRSLTSAGASIFIQKDRIFSIPYRINELGWRAPNHNAVKSNFNKLYTLPTRVQKELQTTYINLNDIQDKEWIKSLPKADLHCHLGGYMDAKITLRLSYYTALISIANYLLNNTFQVRDDLDGKIFLKLFKSLIEKRKDEEINKKFQKLKSSLIKDINNNIPRFKERAIELSALSKRNLKSLNANDIPQELIELSSAEKDLITIGSKYTKVYLGLQPYIVICIFNVLISSEKNVIKNINTKRKSDLISNLEEIFDFKLLTDKNHYNSSNSHIESNFINLTNLSHNKLVDINDTNLKTLTYLMEATHGNPIHKSVGGITLKSFLSGCDYTGSAVLQTRYSLSQCIFHICRKAYEDNIYYLSLRTTPINFTKGGLNREFIWEALKDGYNKFKDELKNKDYFLILTLIIAIKRHYKDTNSIEKNIEFGKENTFDTSVSDMESYFTDGYPTNELLKECPFVVGFDLTGLENDNDPKKFTDKFEKIFAMCMPITIHAGEETDAKNIWDAAYNLKADRIGHGLSLSQKDHEIAKNLLNKFRDFKICIELCPSSNYLTQTRFKVYNDDNELYYFTSCYHSRTSHSGKDYPLRYFLNKKLNVVVCTDDPAIQNTSLTDEFLWASAMSYDEDNNQLGITKWEVLHIIRNSFKSTFLNQLLKESLMTTIGNKIFNKIEKNYYFNTK